MFEEKAKSIQLRVPAEWLEKLDDWRREQSDAPSRAEAIRRLVEEGIGL